jgi:uncharacterized membrane protein
MKNFHKLLIITLCLILISIPIDAKSDSLEIDDYVIDYSYDDARAGETFRLTVTITNQDNIERTNVVFNLDLNNPFDALGDDSWNIGNMSIDESKTKTFRIEVDEDVDETDFDVDFDLEDDIINEEDFLEIELNKAVDLIIGDVKSLPTTLMPDTDDIKLSITVENTGDEDAEFVRGSLILPNGFSASDSYSDTINLGVIKAGESKTADFFVDTSKSLDSREYTGILRINYESSNIKESENLQFGLPVKGRPLFSILSIGTEPLNLMPGDEGTLKITIINNGQEDGMETSVRIFENSDMPFEFDDKTTFIGSLRPGQQGTGILNFAVIDDANANNYIVKVQIRTVSENDVLISEENIEINVKEKEGSGFGVVLVIFYIIIIGVVGFFLYKKLKK